MDFIVPASRRNLKFVKLFFAFMHLLHWYIPSLLHCFIEPKLRAKFEIERFWITPVLPYLAANSSHFFILAIKSQRRLKESQRRTRNYSHYFHTGYLPAHYGRPYAGRFLHLHICTFTHLHILPMWSIFPTVSYVFYPARLPEKRAKDNFILFKQFSTQITQI